MHLSQVSHICHRQKGFLFEQTLSSGYLLDAFLIILTSEMICAFCWIMNVKKSWKRPSKIQSCQVYCSGTSVWFLCWWVVFSNQQYFYNIEVKTCVMAKGFTKTGRIQFSPIPPVYLKVYTAHNCLPVLLCVSRCVLQGGGLWCLDRAVTCLVWSKVGFQMVISSLVQARISCVHVLSERHLLYLYIKISENLQAIFPFSEVFKA